MFFFVFHFNHSGGKRCTTQTEAMDIWPKKYNLILIEYFSESMKNFVFFFVYCRWFVPTSELQKTRIMFAWRCIHCTLRFENNASQKSVRIYKHIPMKKSRFLKNYAFVICSDEIISVSTQKVTKLGDGSGNIGSPKFSDEIYLTDDFYGSSNTK